MGPSQPHPTPRQPVIKRRLPGQCRATSHAVLSPPRAAITGANATENGDTCRRRLWLPGRSHGLHSHSRWFPDSPRGPAAAASPAGGQAEGGAGGAAHLLPGAAHLLLHQRHHPRRHPPGLLQPEPRQDGLMGAAGGRRTGRALLAVRAPLCRILALPGGCHSVRALGAQALPSRHSVRHESAQVLDEFAQENIQSLYKFNFSKNRDVLSAADQLPQPAFYLDRGVRLQRLSRPGGQNKVGFRLCNSTGGDCLCRASTSAVTAAREWYCFHYVNVLALMPTAHEDSHRSDRGHFVLSCQFDGQDCQARHFRTFHHPTYGSCYTFDGVSAAQHQGVTRGISLVLRAEQRHHLPLLSTEAGARVMIHGHDHTPFLEHQGFSIRPGTETTIGIREDEVRRLGNPYSHCSEGADGMDVPLLYNASYTLQACLVSCFQQLMVETCSCGYFFYPLPSGAEYCSSARHPAWGHCFYRLSRDLGTHRLPCSSRCPRPCRESSYKLSAGTSRWPSSKSADWILAALGKHGHRSLGQTPGLRSSVAKVNIFYQELNYRRVDETPVYSVPQLLSAMGSLWSLWFGSSVLSVLELLELLLDALALVVLRGCRWLHTAQGSQLGAATGAPPTIPGTEQLPTDRRNINHLGGPAGLVPRNPSRSSGQSLC
ncbi:amiloride-sensitive sodium channel subunit delta isoform X3 [Mustela nigripes]|nr:amiloride-sensitive sodium channel subunit delta isoform X3 [Mustela nigripes]XP_059231105.1 amiloride-sensitive sodium channel subunit delta isoform X3 [Mustela nigripes]